PIDLENGGHKEFEYFKATQPKDWSFVGFYTFRERQTDFSKLFNLEAFKLRKALNHLLENGSTEEKAYATKLFEALKVMTRSSDWSEAHSLGYSPGLGGSLAGKPLKNCGSSGRVFTFYDYEEILRDVF
ncbi:6736_t:CDS:1, partial [Ambispora leptoticha]